MKLSQFQFNLSKSKVASEPPRWRDECRLMVLNRNTGEIEHRLFKNIIDYFGKGDTFVLNDTKVFPARLYGNKEKTGADIEVFLLRELNREQRLWDVIVDPARKIRIGNKLYFGEDESLVAEVIDNTTSRGRTLRFLYDGSYEDFKSTLFSLGETPVPKWVKEKVTPEDAENFQTIFAAHEGAVSAPAAGLHFSRELFNRMILKDINKVFITLHMGIGHFRSVDVEDLSKHKTDSERELHEADHRKCCLRLNTRRIFEVHIMHEDVAICCDFQILKYQELSECRGKRQGITRTQPHDRIMEIRQASKSGAGTKQSAGISIRQEQRHTASAIDGYS